MKNIISLLFFISSLLVNVSAKSENLDIMYLSSAYSMGKIFEKLNLTLDIIPQLAPEIAEKIKNFVYKTTSSVPEYKKEENSICTDEEKLIHAKISALINMQRDPNAKNFGDEFVYMYLSHYIDIPYEYLGTTCSENDEEPYLANWITNQDRITYQNFLQTIHRTEILEKCRKIFSDITDVVDRISLVEEVFFEKKYAGLVEHIIEDLFEDGKIDNPLEETPEKIITEYIDHIIDLFKSTNLSEEEVIKEVQESIGKSVLSEDMRSGLFGTINVIFQMSIGAATIIPAVTTMLNFAVLMYTSLVPKAAHVGMLYSLSMRVAARTERYIENDDW